MVGAFGLIFGGISLFAKSFESINLIVLLGSIAIILLGFKGLLYVNKNWKAKIINRVKEQKEGLIGHWSIEHNQWKIYLEEQKTKDKNDLKSFVIMTFMVSYIVGVIMFIFKYEWYFSLLLGLALAGGLSLIIAGLFALSQRNQHDKLSAFDSGEIYFSNEVIIMNQFVISFKQLGQSISNIAIDKERMVPVLNVEITAKSPNGGSNKKEYSIPINIAEIDEVSKVTKFCESVVK